MNNLMHKINSFLGGKPISHYPELYRKDNRNSFGFEIMQATSTVFYDPHTTGNTIDWKQI